MGTTDDGEPLMRVLVLGGTGMLGHKLWQRLSRSFDTFVSVRGPFRDYERHEWFDPHRTLTDVDADRFDSITAAFGIVVPEIVINCIGVVKQRVEAMGPLPTIAMNSMLPHRLANLCRSARARLVHISTDCVFSGRKGCYTEGDPPDPDDLYGRSKLLGEVTSGGCLTLRTSIIGRELGSANGLLEWFLRNRERRVRGFRRAVFSGLTTAALADVIAAIIQRQPELQGLYHVSGDPINKYDLLRLIGEAFHVPTEVEADDTLQIDRSLDSSRFRTEADWMPPGWADMVRDLAAEDSVYRSMSEGLR
jgi:dTDP-4-dehydrorhamnose reductase